MNLHSILHWLFATENPIKLYGFFPVLVWYIFTAVALSWFFGQEIPGINRWHGMVPFTWVIRCAPRIIWFVITPVAIWHFDLVKTKVVQLLSH